MLLPLSLMFTVAISATQTVYDDYFGTPKTTNVSKQTTPSKDTKNVGKDELSPFIKKQNKVIEKDGKSYIENEDNLLILANKDYLMQPTYAPNDLIVPDVQFSFGDKSIEKAHMRRAAGMALKDFFAGAKTAGFDLYAVSGYRSYKRQQEVFSAEVKRVGDKKAREAVAYPGTSEHQTGLAMDISSRSQGFNLTAAFGNTKEGKWAKENAHKYGFILRYPEGKEKITKYQYEAWHFRYVGKEAATIIYKQDWTLEEFFEQVKKLQKKAAND
ncbi:D-alanyl-D-alanine carboxypeptidase family protein [Listeria sp. PSOL-1]|uniref:M15 family metallopeptidase n=1 Tax=Listeria sp. PSOL-1 TaxID=1844999 RepID=UPI0013D45CF6|nr:D-alanyl-D-alanine carboxypeptidase family protein [Listeria sp. PSOL-1]